MRLQSIDFNTVQFAGTNSTAPTGQNSFASLLQAKAALITPPNIGFITEPDSEGYRMTFIKRPNSAFEIDRTLYTQGIGWKGHSFYVEDEKITHTMRDDQPQARQIGWVTGSGIDNKKAYVKAMLRNMPALAKQFSDDTQRLELSKALQQPQL